ncbi:MAG: hypothetical protein A3D26_02990 [Candidatus Blackburnbacteria bacterium RIFCSPHIGHO2_02_FULL_44_20]|uniref:Cell division protein FtsX n=1 Tax=Candidatus Blackburnbacteria bacterium RIFCSPHIGHO2_02_FULL_44_20 TaxID=1797516 RepID=A0A1G1V934_9BACT|nr:MAG: hypothetical protein A3E16_01580 [Candidatus Blackburnbacteria bacterium RIFCSPHIGHO2_12_FULL_44_25]OGY11930.1 MAG: hypothetical protein A3D26_02990 [Candidatus Blackburnbacteria bacterium RIFCSPHIGHO2_02_FULL_44_20]OGY14045.1 MAG: hypothetical protein A3A62_02940 [Candidatus Blackburnbacteria bacterium RIFCSPLOWO2_01_FULL_44_43]
MINTSWKHIRRSPYQALTAVLIMTITFFVATILVVLAYASSSVLKYYETRPQVIAYLKKDVPTEDISAFQNKLEADTRIEDVRFVSKEQALQIYKDATANNPLLSEFVSPKVFPASIEFSVKDLSFAQPLIGELENEGVVEEVAFTASLGSNQNLSQVVERLTSISQYIRVGGGIILTFLLLSSLLVLLVITGMRIASRREEIEILQLIGATPTFIRGPFLLEGMFYGLMGATVGWLFAFLLTLYLSPSLVSFFQGIPFLPKDMLGILQLFGIILGGQIILASALGTLGSFIALKRYLKI